MRPRGITVVALAALAAAPATCFEFVMGGCGGPACAILDTGETKCWGTGTHGRTGHEDTETRGDDPGEMGNNLPTIDLGTGRTVSQIYSTMEDSACALLDNGDFKCWGKGQYGRLGLGDAVNRGDLPGTMGDKLPAIELPSGTAIVKAAVGEDSRCLLLDDTTTRCFGRANWLGLGLGSTAQSVGDDPGEMGNNLMAIDFGAGRYAVDIFAGSDAYCVILDNQALKCWGDNPKGNLGYDDKKDRGAGPQTGCDDCHLMGDKLPAVNLGTSELVRTMELSQQHTCAIFDNGGLKCWGSNCAGELGYEDTLDRGDGDEDALPNLMGDKLPFVNLGTGRTAAAVSLAAPSCGTTCVLRDDGSYVCWGDNPYSLVMDGTTVDYGEEAGTMGDNLKPIYLGRHPDDPANRNRTVCKFEMGEETNCLLLDDCTFTCIGYWPHLAQGDDESRGDEPGELGDGLLPIDLGDGALSKCLAAPPPGSTYSTSTDFTHCLYEAAQGGALCKSIADWPSVGGTVPTELGKISGLEALRLSDGRTSGSIPTEIGALTRLHTLQIECDGTACGAMSVGRLLPTEIGQLSALNDLILSKLSSPGSTIPTEIGSCTDLELVDIADSTIGGTIPTQLMLASLTQLQLNDLAGLGGTIPTTIGNVLTEPSPTVPHEAATVELSNLPGLTGTLPTELGRMSGLSELHVSGDYNLIGSLPTEVGMMAKLAKLDTFNNDLGGALPTELARIASKAYVLKGDGSIKPNSGGQLTSVDVSGNRMGGVLPTELGRVTDLACTLDNTANTFFTDLGLATRDNFFLPNPTATFAAPSSCQPNEQYSSPPSPPPAQTEAPAEGLDVEGELQISADLSLCGSQPFKDAVCNGLARGIGVQKNRCEVTGCRSGSVVVSYRIKQVAGEYTDTIPISEKLSDIKTKILIADSVSQNTGLLVAAHSIVLVGVSEFGFNPPPPPSPPPSSPPPEPEIQSAQTLTDGELAGTVIGAVLGCCCLVGLVYFIIFFLCKGKRKDEAAGGDEPTLLPDEAAARGSEPAPRDSSQPVSQDSSEPVSRVSPVLRPGATGDVNVTVMRA